MGKLLHGKGTVAIISYPALQSVVARVDGFKKGLSDTPDIKIVAEQPGITREMCIRDRYGDAKVNSYDR